MVVVAAVARRRIVQMLSYPLEFIFSVVSYYALFLVLFFGARAIGGRDISEGDTLSSIAVGYVVFFLTNQSYQAIQSQITTESNTGMLEQLALSPFGLLRVLLTDFAVASLYILLVMSFVMVGIMATTGRWLHFDVLSVATILIMTVGGVLGLGIMLGGLALVFKRVTAVAGIFALSFLFFVAAPVDRFPILKLLPVGHGNTLLRKVLVGAQSVLDFPGDLAILIAVSSAYFALGSVVFLAMDRQARERGLLGQY